jgi:DNA-binding Lrp family transcriptional regulator
LFLLYFLNTLLRTMRKTTKSIGKASAIALTSALAGSESLRAALTAAEQKLLQALRANARASVTELAQTLKLSRTTVQNRLAKLEASGVISGYTVRINPAIERGKLTAYSLLRIDPKRVDAISAAIAKIPQVHQLHSVAGEFDLLGVLKADSTEELDAAIDAVGRVDGIDRTQTSVALRLKFER